MRPDYRSWLLLFGCLLLLLLNSAAARDQADYEIFDLVDEVEQLVGDKENFYTLLGTEQSANQKEITRGYRKQSLFWHPDKNKSPDAQKRQKMMGVVAAILRDEEKRKRYDFFLQNGVPKWRGTGYYYSRHRPGLASVLIGCFVFASVLQYIASWVLCLRRRSLFRELVAEEAEAALRKIPRRSMKRATSKESISELDQSDSVSQSGRSTPVPNNEPLDPENDPVVQFPAPLVTDMMIIQFPRAIVKGVVSLPGAVLDIVTGKRKAKGSKKSGESESGSESDDESEVLVKSSKMKKRRTKENAEDQEDNVKKSNVAGKKSANRRIVNRTAINPKFVPASAASSQSTNSGEWTSEEQTRLSELTTRFPPLTQGRWTLISKALGREEKDVVSKAKSMNLKK